MAESMCVLLVFEEEYRLYIEAIAEAIRTFRSYLNVAVIDSEKLEAEVERFDPQLIITSSSIPTNPVDPQLIASIEISPEPDQLSRFRIGGRYWESTNPTLGEILSVVDETNWLYITSHEVEPIDTNEEEDL
jgi:hypothetical protein